MEPITVRINVSEIVRYRTPELWETFVMGKLREAGVPVKGVLLYGGIESGTLMRRDDPEDFGVTIYTWRP